MVAELWLSADWQLWGVNGRSGGDTGKNPGRSGHASSAVDESSTGSIGWDIEASSRGAQRGGSYNTSRGTGRWSRQC